MTARYPGPQPVPLGNSVSYRELGFCCGISGVAGTISGCRLRIPADMAVIGFDKLVAASGLPPVTPHGLRHGAATLALAADADLRVV